MKTSARIVIAALVAMVLALSILLWPRDEPTPEKRETASPGETARAIATPERGSTAAVPREVQPPDPAGAERVVVRGRVIVSDPMRDGAESASESGTLYLLVASGEAETSIPCSVAEGSFETALPKNSMAAIADVVLGGRRADPDEAERVPVPEDGAMTFRATWRPGTLLHVLGADTRAELPGVTIVRAGGMFADLHEHPGTVAARDVVIENGESPVFLPLDRLARLEDEGLAFFVRARSYAWSRLLVLDRSLERTVLLDRSGDLVVTLENHEPEAGPEPPTLVLYRSLRRDESDERIVVAVEPERGASWRFDGLLPGRYRIEVAIRPYEDEPIVLGEAGVVVEAGATTEATIRLVDPPESPRKAPLSGTLFVSPEWGEVKPALRIEAIGESEGESVTVEFESLVLVSPGLFRFDAGDVAPGRHSATIFPSAYQSAFDVGRDGRDDLRLALPDPADVEIAFVAGESGERITPLSVFWGCAWPEGVSGGSSTGATRDDESGVFRFRAPAGPIDVSVGPDVYSDGTQRIEPKPGPNAFTLTLHRGCGVRLRFRVDGRPAPIGHMLEKSRIRAVGHDGKWTGSGASRESGFIDMRVSVPGLYEITLREMPGYRRPEPLRVDIPSGEFVERTIDLEPLR